MTSPRREGWLFDTDWLSEKGLEQFFKEGEFLPWKKFLFQVEKVSFDRIILKPVAYKKQK